MATFDSSMRSKWLVKYDDRRIIETNLYYDPDIICKKSTYQYDARGRTTERLCVDNYCGWCQQFTDWVHGSISNWAIGESTSCTLDKYEYDSNGRLLKVKMEAFDMIYNSDTIVEITEYKYNGISSEVAEMKKEHLRIQRETEDTTVEITDYKYDSIGNKVEEDVLKKGTDGMWKNWNSNGEEVTFKTFYKYDDRNNLVEDKMYFFFTQDFSPSHPGTKVGEQEEFTYDRLNKMTSANHYFLYRQDDGSETKFASGRRLVMGEAEDQKEYDKQGNVIAISHGGVVTLRREIEYY
jgi:hypothetical protein